MQTLLGPVVEVELVEPDSTVPVGTIFSIRHLLTVPSCEEVREVMESGRCVHKIIKLTETADGFDREHIDSSSHINSEYLSTRNLVGKKLCLVTSTCSESEQCTHSALTNIVITKEQDKCPHEPQALAIYCHSECAEEKFNRVIEKTRMQETRVVMNQNIDKSDKVSYTISVSHGKSEVQKQISHRKLCKYDGVYKLDDSLELPFNCGCERAPCNGEKRVYLKVEPILTTTDQKDLEGLHIEDDFNKDDGPLYCDKQGTHTVTNSESISRIDQALPAPACFLPQTVASAQAVKQITPPVEKMPSETPMKYDFRGATFQGPTNFGTATKSLSAATMSTVQLGDENTQQSIQATDR